MSTMYLLMPGIGKYKGDIKTADLGNSLVVQWLGLCAFTARAQVRSLVGELRSRKLHGAAEKKKKKKRQQTWTSAWSSLRERDAEVILTQ